MDGSVESILADSKRRLTRLKLLSNFFENIDLLSIYIKTQIIHQLFEENKTLDYSKLELFHLQYTDSLLELLLKIKKKKEHDMISVINEININQQYINAFEQKSTNQFDFERKQYSSIFSGFLRNVYKDLSEGKVQQDWNTVLFFHKKYAAEFYRTADNEDVFYSADFPHYLHQDYQIERKLIGRLNIQNFKMRFVCGYKIGRNEYEIFRIFQTDDYFIFDVEGKKLYLKDVVSAKIDLLPNTSNQAKMMLQLKKRSEDLEEHIREEKKRFPDDVTAVLRDYLKNLENIDLMSKIFDVNEETNILRAMLNLNLNQ